MKYTYSKKMACCAFTVALTVSTMVPIPAGELDTEIPAHYEDIVEATNDFDILWSLSDERISPVADTFDEVQTEYQRMINEGVSPEEINSSMITLFQQKRKIKTR